MKTVLSRGLRRAVVLAQESGLFAGLKPYLKSVLLEGALPLSSVAANRSLGGFTDELGNEFNLTEGLRDAVKPGWQWVLKPDKNELPDDKKVRAGYGAARDSVKKALSFLELFDFHLEGKTVLEVGCWNGARSFSLSSMGAGRVTGSDVSGYYVRGGDKDGAAGREKSIYLGALREAVRAVCRPAGPTGEGVIFVEDDITESALPPSGFDLVCSWEVLEHVRDPLKFFAQMERLLKPGGVAFHEYNPFFSINGGHSHCTLDFLWGHVLLGDPDFERYLARFRPDEKDGALDFYRNGLNRMAIGDLERHVETAGLKTLALVPWVERAHLELLTAGVFGLARENYPVVTVTDLTAPFVWTVQKKR